MVINEIPNDESKKDVSVKQVTNELNNEQFVKKDEFNDFKREISDKMNIELSGIKSGIDGINNQLKPKETETDNTELLDFC
jgi:hypothetical protein